MEFETFQQEIRTANTTTSGAVGLDAMLTVISDLLGSFVQFYAEHDARMSITMQHEKEKWVKRIAQKQKRFEVLAVKTYQDLSFEDWFIDEAMVHQSAENLASMVVNLFGCLYDCTQCPTKNDCSGKSWQVCEWFVTGCSAVI